MRLPQTRSRRCRLLGDGSFGTLPHSISNVFCCLHRVQHLEKARALFQGVGPTTRPTRHLVHALRFLPDPFHEQAPHRPRGRRPLGDDGGHCRRQRIVQRRVGVAVESAAQAQSVGALARLQLRVGHAELLVDIHWQRWRREHLSAPILRRWCERRFILGGAWELRRRRGDDQLAREYARRWRRCIDFR